MHFRIPVSPEILAEVTKLDRFQGAWAAQQYVSAERMRSIQKTALAQNIIGSGEHWLTEMTSSQLRDVLTLRQSAMEADS